WGRGGRRPPSSIPPRSRASGRSGRARSNARARGSSSTARTWRASRSRRWAREHRSAEADDRDRTRDRAGPGGGPGRGARPGRAGGDAGARRGACARDQAVAVVTHPSPPPSGASLSIEPVIGWRTWSIELTDDGVCLTSPMQDYEWQPMQPNRARCRSHFGRQLPNPGCGGGLYPVRRLGRLPAAVGAHLPFAAVGSVAMWGRVIEHTVGYRGQLAYPDRIRLVCGRCFVARRDGVPTRVEHSEEGRIGRVWDARATESRLWLEGMTPAELEQQVLSAYAVDVLPLETLHRAGFRAGPVPPIGLIPNARAELPPLRRGRAGGGGGVALSR